ncbi:hypothetical protein ATS85_08340 [Listeria monocytogenes]|nr:hypothetical protein [Listeria monocytogenes]ECL0005313.1 hypothetical protein [Listeria monocytogenes]EEP1609266.1 hypothetical protein [Listeria monocytogenes]EEP1661571.1 hypothetical protein [Listeria monocytogenes]EKC5368538.1 hypothetical protein [Listeria monocytogenes]
MNEQEAKAIVLEWLKEQTGKAASPLITINYFENDFFSYDLPGEVVQAYDSISRHTEYELLAEFAAWGLNDGAANEQ